MRILFIHPFLYRYARGIERYTLSLANALAEKGVQVSILTWREKNGIQLDTPKRGVNVYQMPQFRYYVSKTVILFYLFHLLRQSYDVIIIHFAGYGEAEAIALARILKKIRYNIVFHYPLSQVPHRYREFLKYDTAYNASNLIAVSGFVGEGVREYFAAKCDVIGHGVDTNRFRPNGEVRARLRKQMGLNLNRPVLVSAVALEERKGVQWVIRALPCVLQEFPDVMYFVLGDGPYRSHLEGLVGEIKLQSHVYFLGSQANIEDYYQASDVSLILSSGEASSLVALESMASELPVITSQHPPFNELINTDWGWMVNETEPSAVAEAIKYLLRDRNLRHKMGKLGRQHILDAHTWERVVDQYLTLFLSQLSD